MNSKLARIRDKLAEAKFFFDTGMSFLVFINFSLLVIAASSKLQQAWTVSIFTLWVTLVPTVLLFTYLFGLFLDKVVNYQTSYYKATYKRVPQTLEILDLLNKINSRLEKMEMEIHGRKGV